MPKRTDIKKILIIGSGPIIISQACEFDYSGTQACKSLKEEGFEVVLVNSNPATIMTDPEFADRTYIEPITVEALEGIISRERPDALLPTLGGQTALNISVRLAEEGVLSRYGVRMIGANLEAIKKAEDRDLFRKAMEKIGLDLPQSHIAHNLKEALEKVALIGYPAVIRPAFTLGGTGGGFASCEEEFVTIAKRGLESSMVSQILIEESALGWKEYELEVMRDKADNVVVICSIENFDPMGIHTGDSITVAPAQTLTDREYQRMRDAAIRIIREVGVETGGSNIQFAVHPQTGRMVVIEMNPRVSRSSALASKATGFPIAKIAAKLAVGYFLHEIANDITKETPASFEPTLDYCVVKIPRWAFEKFPSADPRLTIQMKSVGEVMAIGRNFKEALQKGLRGLEIGKGGLEPVVMAPSAELQERLSTAHSERLFYICEAYSRGMGTEEIHRLTHIDPWFLENIREIVQEEQALQEASVREALSRVDVSSQDREFISQVLRQAKQLGFSDSQLARFWGTDEDAVRSLRKELHIEAVYKLVDTCAAEFEAYTPYYYSTYETPFVETRNQKPETRVENEARSSAKSKVMILGGGPNRIGQGIEFDYCCVHASFALKELGKEVIMVNSNPETVSTDYDTSDKLYFEPLTQEDVLNIIEQEKPEGVIVQLGGQTPLNLALGLKEHGVRILGTSVDAIDACEDRKRFAELIERLGLTLPPYGTATSIEEAKKVARGLGYPVLVRPSYVLGGRAMEIVYDEETIDFYMASAASVSPRHPVLIDRFIEDAIEVDVDLVGDGQTYVIGGILEHIEEAGVHSGDAAMSLPPHTLPEEVIEGIRQATYKLARELAVVGLMNIQYAVKGKTIYILEVNPRASRTVPFVSKAIGVPLAKLAAKAMAGVSLKEQGFTREIIPPYICVKESVLPFIKFPGIDITLGPEMKSTGEVMGIDRDFGMAFAKAEEGAYQPLPKEGVIFISLKEKDRHPSIAGLAHRLKDLGFALIATSGTARFLSSYGIQSETIQRVSEGRPNILDLMQEGKVSLIINTPSGKIPRKDEIQIRSQAIARGVPIVTTLPAAWASLKGMEAMKKRGLRVFSIQEYLKELRDAGNTEALAKPR